MEGRQNIENNREFKRTGSDKANQLGPSSPFEGTSQHPQSEAAHQSADNDADRLSELPHNLRKDADQAQSDGNLSFPKGK